jgi:hypothetical protein
VTIPFPDSPTRPQARPPAEDPVLTAVAEAVERLRFGVVQLTVHDSRVVQLDVTDRQRFG